MNIVNLTPHEVNVVLAHSVVKYAKSSEPARVEVTTKQKGLVHGFMPFFVSTLGEVTGLPAPAKDMKRKITLYIVSRMVKDASPDRCDLIIPSGLVRDENGVIIGCKGFE